MTRSSQHRAGVVAAVVTGASAGAHRTGRTRPADPAGQADAL